MKPGIQIKHNSRLIDVCGRRHVVGGWESRHNLPLNPTPCEDADADAADVDGTLDDARMMACQSRRGCKYNRCAVFVDV